jgi:hypothetical protein
VGQRVEDLGNITSLSLSLFLSSLLYSGIQNVTQNLNVTGTPDRNISYTKGEVMAHQLTPYIHGKE